MPAPTGAKRPGKKGTVLAVRTSLMDFQVPRIVHEEVDESRGKFVIEPLDRGFGYTFGNSLRRVLLSSLEGAAVTSVKFEGVAPAADIEAPADLEILNTDLELAHVSSNGRLEMTLTVGRGRGYMPAELN